jgi:hypothetical protein
MMRLLIALPLRKVEKPTISTETIISRTGIKSSSARMPMRAAACPENGGKQKKIAVLQARCVSRAAVGVSFAGQGRRRQ